jgi:hypothetical protein
MRRFKSRLGVALLAGLLAVPAALAAVPYIPSTSQYSEPSQIVATLNYLVQQINLAVTPQTMAQLSTPRNVLDNGGMFVSQRGTGAATCANNGSAIASANYAADRWGCQVNVGSGAGQLTTITATPSPPTGFLNSSKLVRNSGALLQPQCVYQEVPQYKVLGLNTQNVVFSVNIQALAGLAADQGSTTQTANLVIITGTTADQGFGSWTASPAITPAWAGVVTLVNTSIALPVTPAWNRYSTTALVPSGVNEIAVAICFTPTAAGSGATDGIAFTGAQLEVGTVASAFEFRPPGGELAELQRYFTILTEPAAGVAVPVVGNSTSATAAAMSYRFPVTMRAAPTFNALGTALGATTWTNKCGNVNNVLATTFFVTATANGVDGASATVTSTGSTIGFGCNLVGAGGGSILSWSADF